jgi:hypothetical protein
MERVSPIADKGKHIANPVCLLKIWAQFWNTLLVKWKSKFWIIGAIDALRVLYKAGANPLHIDTDSLNGKSEIILAFLPEYYYFNLALHCAATRGHASCIRMLVELYGCSVEGLNKKQENNNFVF